MVLTNAVDDELIATNNNELRLKFLEFLRKRFDIEDMGMAHWYLQGRLTQNEDYLLDQSRYMALIASRFLPQHDNTNVTKEDKTNMNHHYQPHLSPQRKIVQPTCLKFNNWNKPTVFSIPLSLAC